MPTIPPTPLQQIITERIEHMGPITFADYMRMALYQPGYGYYVTGQPKMGWEGDYYTSSDLSALFAHCLGRQLSQMWEQLGCPTPFTVLEQGAGRGNLAQEVRTWAEREAPNLYTALAYHTADIHAGQDALHPVDAPTARSAPTTPPLSPSVILSNELVDAFPVHIVEKHEETLYEVYVAVHEGRLRTVLDEPSSPEVAGYLDTYNIPWRTFPDGWRAEINLDALRWIEQTAALLLGSSTKRKRRGFILTIDYGAKANRLYIPERRQGTLASYFRHQFTEQPLVRPGEQDLTAHVNFSALIAEGRRQGLRLQAFTTQREWLTEMGLFTELERIRARDFTLIDSARASDQGQVALLQWYNLRQRVQSLTAPGGMGDFKVLILKR